MFLLSGFGLISLNSVAHFEKNIICAKIKKQNRVYLIFDLIHFLPAFFHNQDLEAIFFLYKDTEISLAEGTKLHICKFLVHHGFYSPWQVCGTGMVARTVTILHYEEQESSCCRQPSPPHWDPAEDLRCITTNFQYLQASGKPQL